MWPFAVGKPLIMRFVCAPKDNPEPESNSNNNSNSQSELTLASFYRLRGPVVVTLSVNKIYKCQPCFSFHSHTAGWRNTVSIHAPAHGKYRLITLIKTCSRFCLPVVLHAIMNQQMTTSREREREGHFRRLQSLATRGGQNALFIRRRVLHNGSNCNNCLLRCVSYCEDDRCQKEKPQTLRLPSGALGVQLERVECSKRQVMLIHSRQREKP